MESSLHNIQSTDPTVAKHPPGSRCQRIQECMRNYSIAIFSTMTATLLRKELEPILESKVPFGLFFISTLLTAWMAGTGPAILATVLSVVSTAHFIIPPHDSLYLHHPSDVFSLAIYLIVTLASIFIFHQSAAQQRQATESALENSRLNDGLREADRKKDEFLALLAHELRNPLTPIQTAMDLLEADRRWDSNPQAMQTIRRQLCQLVRLVNDLLDASRYVHGKLQIRHETFNLLDAIELAIETNLSVFEDRNHRFNFCLPDHEVLVRGDMPRMAQAISNLLHNASKYTHRNGHIRLSVEIRQAAALIRIEDNGIGIPHDLKNHIFELFSQVNSSRSRREGGLGIGLALVRELVQLHGGSIEVESDGPDRGSRFTIQVPILTPAEKPLITHQTRELPTASPPHITPRDSEGPCEPLAHCDREGLHTAHAAAPDEKIRILMVDDNVDSTAMLAILLTTQGFAADSAADGISGIQKAQEFRPHLILLDIGLPGMDGFEVAKTLRQRPEFQDTRILALSGWDGEEYRQLSRDAGIDEHIAKPFRPQELLRIISDQLARTP